MRTSQTFTASSGQTSFSFTYNVGYLDVFVNGVKLSSSEFTANNGSTVVLSVGSFVGDIVELVSYFTTSYAAGETGILNLFKILHHNLVAIWIYSTKLLKELVILI